MTKKPQTKTHTQKQPTQPTNQPTEKTPPKLELFLAKDMWFLICNLETETYSEKTDMLFDPLHLSLVLHPSNSPSTLPLPAESTHAHTRLSKSCVCAHHGLWRCFHYLTAVHCNVIYSIRFFSKHWTPLAKTTLNLRLNGLRGIKMSESLLSLLPSSAYGTIYPLENTIV